MENLPRDQDANLRIREARGYKILFWVLGLPLVLVAFNDPSSRRGWKLLLLVIALYGIAYGRDIKTRQAASAITPTVHPIGLIFIGAVTFLPLFAGVDDPVTATVFAFLRFVVSVVVVIVVSLFVSIVRKAMEQ